MFNMTNRSNSLTPRHAAVTSNAVAQAPPLSQASSGLISNRTQLRRVFVDRIEKHLRFAHDSNEACRVRVQTIPGDMS